MIGVALIALATAAPPPPPPRPITIEPQIRELREQFNTAIATHEFERMRRFFADDYTILAGSSGRPFDIAAFRERMIPAFADPAFVTYVRTPQRIVVAQNGARVLEAGNWVGIWRSAHGETRLFGSYQATWVPVGGAWRLKNEAFVSLRCAGEAARCDSLY